MHDEKLLQRLIATHGESARAGKTLTPQQVCADHPAYLPLLRQHLLVHGDAVDAASTVDSESAQTADASVPPTIVATMTIAVNQRLGHGGLGDVYAASDRGTGRNLAVKFLNNWAVNQHACRESFRFEATVTSQLEHPNIVPVYVTGATPDGKPFYAMRLIPGRTLGAAIAEFHYQKHSFTVSARSATALRELLGQFALVCKAIAFAHDRGIIHRDIKPANIMLGRFGEVVVLDWGLAARINRDDRARSSGEQSIVMPTQAIGLEPVVNTRDISGTPAYMSPEQHDGGRPVGQPSDVYGLGATLYHLIAGQPPFDGEITAIRQKALAGDVVLPSRVKRGVSRTLEAICLKAMACDPVDRYETPLDLACDVESYLADLPVKAYREPPLRTLARWTRRHRTITQAGFGVLIAMALLAGAASLLLQRVAHDQYRSRQTALTLAARLAASTVALQIDFRWRILEYEASDNDLVEAMAAVAKKPIATQKGRARWTAVQSEIEAIAAATKGAVGAESWFVCDTTGVQIARSPVADTIGQGFAHRDYFHGGDSDLEPGTAASPLKDVHRSTVYKSASTGKLKVAFSAPIWSAKPTTENRECLGVLVMSFDVGSLFRSIDAIGSWNASRMPFSVAIVDLRDDSVDGTPTPGLVLENPDAARLDPDADPSSQRLRAPWDVVQKLRAVARQSPALGQAIPADSGSQATDSALVNDVSNLLPGALKAMLGGVGTPAIAAAEPIVILGRPSHIADIGWAVLVHER